MAWTLPEVIMRRVIDDGLKRLRQNKAAFIDIFSDLAKDELGSEYGANYLEQMWTWFSTTKLPVVQSWSFNVQKIPCYSIHLANEQEDEQKAAFDDYAGTFDGDSTTGTAAFTVMLDIGIHANKGADHVLWMYYVLSYILFKSKPDLHRLGLRLGTYSASDYSKDAEKMPNSIWTRWVRYRCTTQNDWSAEPLGQIDDLNMDQTENSDGFKVSRIHDVDGDEDLNV